MVYEKYLGITQYKNNIGLTESKFLKNIILEIQIKRLQKSTIQYLKLAKKMLKTDITNLLKGKIILIKKNF